MDKAQDSVAPAAGPPDEPRAMVELPREVLIRVRLEADDRLCAAIDRLSALLGGIFHVSDTKCPHGTERGKGFYCPMCGRNV